MGTGVLIILIASVISRTSSWRAPQTGQQEIASSPHSGASRLRMVRQLLTETMDAVVVGGLAGIATAAFALGPCFDFSRTESPGSAKSA